MSPQAPQGELTAPLRQAWLARLDTTSAEAFALLDALAADTPASLARHFYAVLMDDSRANRFLTMNRSATACSRPCSAGCSRCCAHAAGMSMPCCSSRT